MGGKGRYSGWIAALILGVASSACQGTPPPITPLGNEEKQPNRTPLPSDVLEKMWRVEGSQIKDGRNRPVHLRGIAFGNEVWSHTAIPSAHHAGVDYGVVASMGMNVVRFYLSYNTFEDDARPFKYEDAGWAWLDQNVEWAQSHGVRLVLNMHDPVGGYQSLGKGGALWREPDKQERFIQLWRAIAERYRAEPTIAGFDLLNEPVPTESIDQWKDLAERTIAEIREVDQHHIVFLERVNAVGGDWAENADRNFFKVGDPNVVYEFHFYKPFHFTHQSADWVAFAAREGWYPDENMPEVDWFQLTPVATVDSDPLPAGSSDWTLLETKPFLVQNPKIAVGKPFLVCDDGAGTATFDSLSLSRTDPAPPPPAPVAPPKGKKVKPPPPPAPVVDTQFEIDLDTLRGWYFWKQGEPAKSDAGHAYLDLHGHGDSTALSIARTVGLANLGADPLRFFPKQGSEYVLRALAKGRGLGERARCLIRLEFYSSQVPVLPRDKRYLEQEVQAYLAWGQKNDVPLYLGEFGTIRQSFLPGRGGLNWVSDMLDVLLEHGVHFTYHAYHEMPFGLFLGGDTLPSEPRLYVPLYELLAKKLGGSGVPPWGPLESLASSDAQQGGGEEAEGGDEASGVQAEGQAPEQAAEEQW